MRRSLLHASLISVLVSLMLIVAVVLGSYNLTAVHMHSQRENASRTSVTEAAAYADSQLSTQISMGNTVVRSADVTAFLAGGTSVRLQLRDKVRSFLTNYVSFTSGARMAYLYDPSGSWLASTDSSDRPSIDVFRLSRRLFRELELSKPFRNAIISDCYPCGSERCYAVITPVLYSPGVPRLTDYKGVLILILNVENLTAALPGESRTGGFLCAGDAYLCGSKAMYDAWQQGAETFRCELSSAPWTVHITPDTGSETDELRRLRTISTIVIAASVLSMGLLLAYQSRRMVRPVTELAHQVRDIGQSRTLLEEHSSGIAEISELTSSINDMVTRLDQLHEEVAQARLQSLEEQLAFLQAQINPHFLYNTFECIRGMAASGQRDELRRVTSCMAGIYRYCAVKTPLVPLEMEYDCLRNYMEVMGLRYGPVYRMEIDADEASLSASVPRMCLQPLVENAISHGFVDREPKHGLIRIQSRMESGSLWLVLEDDGVGLDDEQLARYNAPQDGRIAETDSHIGIRNVMSRFRLLYPQKCAIRFTRSPLGGLRVEMRLDGINT